MSLFIDLFAFGLCLVIVLKSVDYAIRFSSKLAEYFGITPFAISFFVVAIVSALPETIIGTMATLRGQGDVAFMTLMGSNVVDLTFVFGAVVLVLGTIKVDSKVVRKDALYLCLLLLPFLLGIDGKIERQEGVVLIIAGLLFFYSLAMQGAMTRKTVERAHYPRIARLVLWLVMSLLIMVFAAGFTVHFLSNFALDIGVPTFLVALLVIGTGVCLPEMLFTIQSVRKNKSDLALGDILGTVVIDSTIALGIVALIGPISMDMTVMRVTALFSAVAGCVLIYFLKVNKQLTRIEGILLLAFYAAFVFVQFAMQFS